MLDIPTTWCETWCERVTPQQERRLIHQQAEIDATGIHRPFYSAATFRYSTPVGEERLRSTVAELVRHHEGLRLIFHRHGDQWHATSAPELPVSLVSRIALSTWSGEALDEEFVRAVAQFAPGSPHHLAVAVDNSGSDSVVTVLVDHMVVDAYSWSVLLADLGTVYRGDVDGLGPADTSGRDALAAVRAEFDEAEIPEEWQPLVQEMAAVTPIGWINFATTTEMSVPRSDAVRVRASLDIGAERLRQACQTARRTQFSLLLAAVYGALNRMSPEPAYMYVYPSFREGLGLGTSIGWLSGQAILLIPRELDGDALWAAAHVDAIVASAHQWAITELINEKVDVSRRFATRPSLSMGFDQGAQGLDLGLEISANPPIQRISVQTRGRIAVEFLPTTAGLECTVSYEPIRFEHKLINEFIVLVRECLHSLIDGRPRARPSSLDSDRTGNTEGRKDGHGDHRQIDDHSRAR